MVADEFRDAKAWRYLLLLLDRAGGPGACRDFIDMIESAMREDQMREMIAGGWPAGPPHTIVRSPAPPAVQRAKNVKTKAEYDNDIAEQRADIIQRGNKE